MALTIKYNPVDYSSAHEDVLFVLLEDTKPFDSTTYPDYKYVCDIYIYGILQARLKAFPRPDDKLGIFNIGNIVRNYLYTIFQPLPNQIISQRLGENAFYVNVICRFGEEYGFTTYTNLIVDSQRSYFNHYNGRQFGTNTILTSVLDKTMTNRPYATPVDINSKFCFIPFLASDDTTFQVQVKCYNSNGLVRSVNYNVSPTTGSFNELQQINLAPQNINAVSPGTIDGLVEYYTVTFNTTNIIDDTTLRFNLTCESKYDVWTIHFLNKYGGFESKDFSKVSRSTIDITKSNFGQSAYLVKNDGTVSRFDSSSNVYREQVATYASVWNEKMQLNSNFLTDSEYVWLSELIKSPLVYIEYNGYFFPINITNTNYENKKSINDHLTNLMLNIQFGENYNTQYR
jgi:hypothetical protein